MLRGHDYFQQGPDGILLLLDFVESMSHPGVGLSNCLAPHILLAVRSKLLFLQSLPFYLLGSLCDLVYEALLFGDEVVVCFALAEAAEDALG